MDIKEAIFSEKYRPDFNDIICEHKSTILKYLEKPKELPSFIFHSVSPGTGKTSMARAIASYLDCDIQIINSSDERGIDTIRDKVKLWVRSLSDNPDCKRLVFCDEFDGTTKQAQDSLRNLMEEYSGNAFFIFSCNDLTKIIQPIQSRCQLLDFDNPDKSEIVSRLVGITDKEKITIEYSDIVDVADNYYPDMRAMLKSLYNYKLTSLLDFTNEFDMYINTIQMQNRNQFYEDVYSGKLNYKAFNKWLFKYMFKNYQTNQLQICELLADTEKSINLGVTGEIVFLSNMIKIMELWN